MKTKTRIAQISLVVIALLLTTFPVSADDLATSTEAGKENARQERIKWWREG